MITLIVPCTDAPQGQTTMRALTDRAGYPTYPVLIYDEHRTGYTSAVNQGLMTAMEREEDACICVDDVRPTQDDWLRMLVEGAALSDDIWFAGPSGACRTPPQNMGRPGDDYGVQYVSHVAGFCWLIKYEALRRLGLLTEGLENYGSDVDYQWRGRRLGGRSVWVRHVYVEHELHAPRQPYWDEDNERFRELWP